MTLAIMNNHAVTINPAASDFELQKQLLAGVSRTFALTIPQLPEPLCTVVTNAYLLCRINDTIEDDTQLTLSQKMTYHQLFRELLVSDVSPQSFVHELDSSLAADTPIAERQLIQHMPLVLRCLRAFTPLQQSSLQRCVSIMSEGMPEFQHNASIAGLENMAALDQYCFYVAGVVGEMLTELFCDYVPEMRSHKKRLMTLAVSFGQGLQMTNILKDFWEDRHRGVCWLPRDLFTQHGVDLPTFSGDSQSPGFQAALRQLVVIAKQHLTQALEYTAIIPYREKGIRRFALWAIGLAILTLRNIYRHPQFTKSNQIKVSRRMLRTTILVCNLSHRSNYLLKYLFDRLARTMT